MTKARDNLGWLTRINMASLVMLVERALVAPGVAARIAHAIDDVEDVGGDRREGLADYLAYEGELTARCGPIASEAHVGRSRIDINRTRFRLSQRDALLSVGDALNDAREAVVALAKRDPDAIVPTYTLGAQSQPTSLGHYLSAFADALGRNADRIQFVYRALNRSPLGAAAAITSTFPLDRPRLAELLGFDAPIVNAFDAVHLAPLDSGLELAHVARSIALTIDLFLADHAAQYRAGTIWFEFDAGHVGTSSLMPHKRNPDPVNAMRRTVGELLGACMTFELLCHNVTPGVTDYSGPHPTEIATRTTSLLAAFKALLEAVRFDAAVALQVVRGAGGASTELMNVLVRRGGLPPRQAHDLVSELIDRFKGDIAGFHTASYAAACSLFRGGAFPLQEAEYYAALDPAAIVRGAAGLGGSQRAQVDQMLAAAVGGIAEDRAWQSARREELATRAAALDAAFDTLRKS